MSYRQCDGVGGRELRPAGVVLLVLILAGCAAGRVGGRGSGYGGAPDYGRPFAIVTSSYTAPAVLGVTDRGVIGGWREEISLDKWVRGWTHKPVSRDSDPAVVNYVLHPLSGSETHMIARDNGWSFAESALFDLFGSVYWEYVFENVFEPPSRTDLLTTGPLGAVLGEVRFQSKQAGFLPGLMDPFGSRYAGPGDVRGPDLETADRGVYVTLFKIGF